jgi:hypothetical protein
MTSSRTIPSGTSYVHGGSTNVVQIMTPDRPSGKLDLGGHEHDLAVPVPPPEPDVGLIFPRT